MNELALVFARKVVERAGEWLVDAVRQRLERDQRERERSAARWRQLRDPDHVWPEPEAKCPLDR